MIAILGLNLTSLSGQVVLLNVVGLALSPGVHHWSCCLNVAWCSESRIGEAEEGHWWNGDCGLERSSKFPWEDFLLGDCLVEQSAGATNCQPNFRGWWSWLSRMNWWQTSPVVQVSDHLLCSLQVEQDCLWKLGEIVLMQCHLAWFRTIGQTMWLGDWDLFNVAIFEHIPWNYFASTSATETHNLPVGTWRKWKHPCFLQSRGFLSLTSNWRPPSSCTSQKVFTAPSLFLSDH